MKKASILFVDNQDKFLETKTELLRRKGYEVLSASNSADALKLARTKPVNLALLDIRLNDEEDSHDTSGLELAKQLDPAIPKIMLTGYPTWELVRQALGSTVDELPLAVDFIAKSEGTDTLLSAIDLNLHQPQLRQNLLNAFQVHTLMAIPDQLKTLGAEEASSRLQQSFALTSEQLTEYREVENKRAAQYHFWGLAMTILALLLIVLSVVLILGGQVSLTTATLVSSALSQSISLLLFRREDAAHKRVQNYFVQLNELNYLGNLLTICDTLQSPANRETYKMKVIDKVTERWFERNVA